jgi:hypothetical protein
MQVNEMLQTKYINYVPAAVGAGLMPLLSAVLASDSHNAASQQAVMRCLRLVTETEFGISTVLEQPELRQNIAKTSTKIMSEWCATPGHPLLGKITNAVTANQITAAAAARAVTDALLVQANIYGAGINST